MAIEAITRASIDSFGFGIFYHVCVTAAIVALYALFALIVLLFESHVVTSSLPFLTAVLFIVVMVGTIIASRLVYCFIIQAVEILAAVNLHKACERISGSLQPEVHFSFDWRLSTPSEFSHNHPPSSAAITITASSGHHRRMWSTPEITQNKPLVPETYPMVPGSPEEADAGLLQQMDDTTSDILD